MVFLINLFIFKRLQYLSTILEESKNILDGNLNQKIEVKGNGTFSNLAYNINNVVGLTNDCIKDCIKNDIIITNLLQEISNNNNIEKQELNTLLGKVRYNSNLNLENINLNYFINDILSYYKMDFSQNNLYLKYSSNEDIININADKKLLHQALTQLISNILKHSMNNTKVYIQLQSIDDKVYLSLKNICKDELNIDSIRSNDISNIRLCENILAIQDITFNIELEASLFKAILIF